MSSSPPSSRHSPRLAWLAGCTLAGGAGALAAQWWLAAGQGLGGRGLGAEAGAGDRPWPPAAAPDEGRGEGGSSDPEEWPWLSAGAGGRPGGTNWDPEEEWLLELNANLPPKIDANTRRYQAVRDRMRGGARGQAPHHVRGCDRGGRVQQDVGCTEG